MADRPPALPSHVSSNGAEIWDWARDLSAWRQKQRRIAELRLAIAKVRCGNCYHWMKSSQCPKERNENGRRRGPSCEGVICGQFEEDPIWSAPRREELRAELASLLNKDTPTHDR